MKGLGVVSDRSFLSKDHVCTENTMVNMNEQERTARAIPPLPNDTDEEISYLMKSTLNESHEPIKIRH